MPRDSVRSEWISYLRVSTHEQAERDLSLPAQRHAVEEYAARHGVQIAREYVEAGCSGTNSNRKAFRKMLEDVLRPNSTVGTVVVHHTSRFTRDSTKLIAQPLSKCGEHCDCHRRWGCIDSHGLPPEAIKTGTSHELPYDIQALTNAA